MLYFGFTEVKDLGSLIDEQLILREKMHGKFNLKIKKDLPSQLKIQQYANEQVAFHLHKKRDFLERLKGKRNLKEEMSS